MKNKPADPVKLLDIAIQIGADLPQSSARDPWDKSWRPPVEMRIKALELASLCRQLIAANRIAWGIVHNAYRQPGKRPLWSHVSELTGLGSTAAAELCAAQGCDPDRVVGDGQGHEP